MDNNQKLSWFNTHVITPNIWAIDDNGLDVMYVITGSERALLIDTGMGVGDLAAEVQALTSLPLVVANTHAHPDHIGGNGQFARVYIAAGDRETATHPWTEADRAFCYQQFFQGENPRTPPPGFVLEKWGASVAAEILPIEPGQVFDLGGRQLEALPIPGHTPGCMAFLDRQARLLFVGDAILSGVWMHLDESLPLHIFKGGLEKVWARRDAFDCMYSGHNIKPFPVADLEGYIDGIGKILAGEIVGQPEHTFAGDGLRWNYQSLGVLYRADRL